GSKTVKKGSQGPKPSSVHRDKFLSLTRPSLVHPSSFSSPTRCRAFWGSWARKSQMRPRTRASAWWCSKHYWSTIVLSISRTADGLNKFVQETESIRRKDISRHGNPPARKCDRSRAGITRTCSPLAVRILPLDDRFFPQSSLGSDPLGELT